MAIMGSVVFIHPLDMGRLLKHDPYILDILKYNWHDGFEVSEINGIVYRQTLNVPETLTDDPEDDDITEIHPLDMAEMLQDSNPQAVRLMGSLPVLNGKTYHQSLDATRKGNTIV